MAPRRRFILTQALISWAICIAMVGCASMAPRLEPGHVGYLGASTADVLTTRAALDRGATEVNPFLGESPSTAKLVGLKMAGWFLFRGLEKELEDSMGRKMRWYEKLLFWAIPTGLAAWAAGHNNGVCRPEC